MSSHWSVREDDRKREGLENSKQLPTFCNNTFYLLNEKKKTLYEIIKLLGTVLQILKTNIKNAANKLLIVSDENN